MLYENNENVGVTITISGGNITRTIDYYTITFEVKDNDFAGGSKIKAEYNGKAITSGEAVLSGKNLSVTVIPNNAHTYEYKWSGEGIIGETGHSVLIAEISKPIEILCTVTGYDAPKPAENKYYIKGKVTDDLGELLKDVAVTIQESGKIIAGPVSTDDNGGFKISDNVPYGVYSLVFVYTDSKNDNKVTTETIILKINSMTIADGYIDVGTITMILGRKNTIFNPKEGDYIPPSAVEGLEKVFDNVNGNVDDRLGVTAADMGIIDNGGEVKVYLTSEPVKPEDEAKRNEVINLARSDNKPLGFQIDLSAYKQVTPLNENTVTTILSEINNHVKIYIPLPDEHKGKKDYGVYRYHNNGAERIPLYPEMNDDGEYFEVIDGEMIVLTIKKFSVYAVAYNDGFLDNNNNNDNEDDVPEDTKPAYVPVIISKNKDSEIIENADEIENIDEIVDIAEIEYIDEIKKIEEIEDDDKPVTVNNPIDINSPDEAVIPDDESGDFNPRTGVIITFTSTFVSGLISITAISLRKKHKKKNNN